MMLICFDCFWICSIADASVSIMSFIEMSTFWLSENIFAIVLISLDSDFVESDTAAIFLTSVSESFYVRETAGFSVAFAAFFGFFDIKIMGGC
jgi:hypothetical protein